MGRNTTMVPSLRIPFLRNSCIMINLLRFSGMAAAASHSFSQTFGQIRRQIGSQDFTLG